MGKMYDSLLSGTSGRTGKVVVANVYGNEITRVRPRRKKEDGTLKQQLIRQRMVMCVNFMESYRTYACKYFGERSGMKSTYNLAMANVLKNFIIDDDASTITPNYGGIQFSKGKLLAVIPLALALPSADALEVNWTDNSGGNPDRALDQAQVLVAAEGDTTTFFAENMATRSAQTVSVPLPVQFQGKTLHVWMAFKSADEEQASNSVYLGSIS